MRRRALWSVTGEATRTTEGVLMPALDGMRVLDFTQYEAGPSCCQYLAWLGADVVKVEPPRGEPGRKTGAPDGGKAQYYENYNANKRSVVVDVSTEAGRDLVRRLVTGFDVFVENQGPRVMEKLGPRPARRCRPSHPALIYARIKGYGLSGPVRRLPQLRHARPGRGRAVLAHRRCRRPADAPGRHVRRHRHRRPHGDGDPRRLRAAAAHGRGPGDRDEHARGHDDVHPHDRHAGLGPRRRAGAAHRQQARRRAVGHVPVPAVRRRTTTST